MALRLTCGVLQRRVDEWRLSWTMFCPAVEHLGMKGDLDTLDKVVTVMQRGGGPAVVFGALESAAVLSNMATCQGVAAYVDAERFVAVLPWHEFTADEQTEMMLLAMRHNAERMVRAALAHEARPDADIDPLRFAAMRGFTGIIQAVIDDGRLNPMVNSNAMLMAASMWGQTDVIRILVADPRMKPAARRFAALLADEEGHDDTVRALMSVFHTDSPAQLYTDAPS